MEKYYAVKNNDSKTTHIKVEVYYSLGGMNYFTYKTERRGYYLSVCPVTIEERDGWRSEGFTLFTGTKWLLKEVKRKSAKAETEAIKKSQQVLTGCIQHVLAENGLELAEEKEADKPLMEKANGKAQEEQ